MISSLKVSIKVFSLAKQANFNLGIMKELVAIFLLSMIHLNNTI